MPTALLESRLNFSSLLRVLSCAGRSTLSSSTIVIQIRFGCRLIPNVPCVSAGNKPSSDTWPRAGGSGRAAHLSRKAVPGIGNLRYALDSPPRRQGQLDGHPIAFLGAITSPIVIGVCMIHKYTSEGWALRAEYPAEFLLQIHCVDGGMAVFWLRMLSVYTHTGTSTAAAFCCIWYKGDAGLERVREPGETNSSSQLGMGGCPSSDSCLAPAAGSPRGVRALGVVRGCGTEQHEGEGNGNAKCFEVTLSDVGISLCSLPLCFRHI